MDLEEDHRPLLPEDQASSVLSSAMVEAILSETPGPTGRCYIRLAGWESRLLWLLSGSSIIVSVCNYMLSFVTLTFSGHLGTLELAGASLAMVGTQGLAYGIMDLVVAADLNQGSVDEKPSLKEQKSIWVLGPKVMEPMEMEEGPNQTEGRMSADLNWRDSVEDRVPTLKERDKRSLVDLNLGETEIEEWIRMVEPKDGLSSKQRRRRSEYGLLPKLPADLVVKD
ncbi:Protein DETOXIFICATION 41 [Sarracenia purpurea var. burkii]